MSDVAVELWTGGLPRIGWFAEHHWLLIIRPRQTDRWEVWQTADCGGESWGHLHRNLLPPRASIGRRPARCLRRWGGEVAQRLAERIETAPHHYPWTHWYRYVPGPNSNTFVQWVLDGECRLGRRGIGRGFASRVTRRRRSGLVLTTLVSGRTLRPLARAIEGRQHAASQSLARSASGQVLTYRGD